MPVAIPICRNVLLVPDAIPAWRGSTTLTGGGGERRVDEADPDSGDEEARDERRPVEEGEPCRSSRATPHRASPPPSRNRTGTRVDSRPAIGATTNASSDSGRKMTPVHRRITQHALEIQREEEELREHPGRDREGGDLRTGEGGHPEEAEVDIGDPAAAPPRANETSSTAAAAKSPTTRPLDQPQSLPRSKPSTSANSPPVSVSRPATSKLPASSSRVSRSTRTPARHRRSRSGC